jgi:hypothetical protein
LLAPDTDTDGSGVVMYIKNGLRHRVVCQLIELGVEFLFVEIRLRDMVIFASTLYRPLNSSIVYRMLSSEKYGSDALECLL